MEDVALISVREGDGQKCENPRDIGIPDSLVTDSLNFTYNKSEIIVVQNLHLLLKTSYNKFEFAGCYGLNVCVFPKCICWSLNPKDD